MLNNILSSSHIPPPCGQPPYYILALFFTKSTKNEQFSENYHKKIAAVKTLVFFVGRI